MKKKLKRLSVWTFALALVTFAVDYICFHFLTDQGFSVVWQPEAEKPMVTVLLGILGVLFLFASVMCLLTEKILFTEKEDDNAGNTH